MGAWPRSPPSTRPTSKQLRSTSGERSSCDRLSRGRYSDRAGVIFQAASPQRSGFISIAPPEALARSAADLRTALCAWSRERPDAWVTWASTCSPRECSRRTSVCSTRASTTRAGPSRSTPASRSTDTTWALRWPRVAASTKHEPPTRRRSWPPSMSIPANRVLRQEPNIEESWLAGALTDLEIVNRYRTQLERRPAEPASRRRSSASRSTSLAGSLPSLRTRHRVTGDVCRHHADDLPGGVCSGTARSQTTTRRATRSRRSGTTTTLRAMAGRSSPRFR